VLALTMEEDDNSVIQMLQYGVKGYLLKNISSEELHLAILSNQINALRLNFAHPEQNQVKHVHHFHKHIWISFSLFIVSLLFAYGWMNCHSEKKQFEANDIKYRFWKANGNTSLLKVVYQTDSLYNLNKDVFTNGVLRAEHTIAEQEKKHRLAGEKTENRWECKINCVK